MSESDKATQELLDWKQKLGKTKNLGELRTLIFDLGASYDNLLGDTKDAKLDSFLNQLISQKQLSNLEKYLNHEPLSMIGLPVDRLSLLSWRRGLSARVNLEELRDLMYDMDVEDDNLSGNVKDNKIVSFLENLERSGRLLAFKDYVFSEPSLSHIQDEYHAELFDLNRRNIDDVSAEQSPYQGMEAFQEEDAPLFFGREVLTKQLFDDLNFILDAPKKVNFLAVIGASGSGKSSLVRAGLVPALRNAGKPIIVITPTANPLQSLARGIANKNDPKETLTIQDNLSDDERMFYEYLPILLEKFESKQKRLVLVIDQFEELFTLCDSEEVRQQFVANLLFALAPERKASLAVLITLRADFYHRVAWSDGLRELLSNQQAFIGRMSTNELERAIEGPAVALGYKFQDGLIQQILNDVGNQPGNLPLLSHALLETWKHREGDDQKIFTFAGYEKAGGVKQAIAKTADAELKEFSDDEKVIARNIFTRLTELGQGTEDTRRRAKLAELIPVDGEDENVTAVLAKLVGARLITADRERVEVAHEALIREWGTLRKWLDADRDGLRILDQLIEAATFWETNNHREEDLYTGTRLNQTQDWKHDKNPQLSTLEAKFLTQSQERVKSLKKLAAEREEQEKVQLKKIAEEAEKRREIEANARKQAEADTAKVQNRNRIALGLSGIAITLAIVSFVFFSRANRSALAESDAREASQINESIALTSEANAIKSEEEAILSASIALTQEAIAIIEAERADNEASAAITAEQEALESEEKAESQAKIAQAQALMSLSTVLFPQGQNPTITETERSLLLAVEALNINSAADQQMNSVFINNQLNRVFDEIKNRPGWTPLLGHNDIVLSVSVSPDGQLLASGSVDKTIRLWNLQDPSTQPQVFIGHEDSVHSVAFSPDGKTLASGSADATIRLWDLEQMAQNSNLQPRILEGHEDWVWSVAFSIDGETLASGGSDKTIRLWSLNDLDESFAPKMRMLEGHENWVSSVAFSPDGQTLASSSSDQTIRLWNLEQLSTDTNVEPKILVGHEGWVRTITFSPDGKSLASSSSDKTIRLWNLDSLDFDLDDQPQILEGHDDIVFSISFSPDGQSLASSSGDQTIRLWNLDELGLDSTAAPRVLEGHEGWVWSVSFSPNGQTLVSGSADRTIRKWDVSDLIAETQILEGHDDIVLSISFSPDGKTLASGSSDKTIRLWNLEQLSSNPNTLPVVLKGHEDLVMSVAFSPDGKILASGSADQTIRLWDLELVETNPDARPLILNGHTDWVRIVSFSPDGKTLASGGTDLTIRLWDIEQLTSNPAFSPLILEGHEDLVLTLFFSPDNKILSSGSSDQTIRLWDLELLRLDSATVPIVLRGHQGLVRSVPFSPDGKTLASSSDDQTIRLWDLEQLSTNPNAQPLIFNGHEAAVLSIAFSPDGQNLVSSSADQTIRLWDLSDFGAEPIVLEGHEDWIWSVSFSPNGETLASSSSDKTIRLWSTIQGKSELACKRTTRNFTWQEWQTYNSTLPYGQTCFNLPIHSSIPENIKLDLANG